MDEEKPTKDNRKQVVIWTHVNGKLCSKSAVLENPSLSALHSLFYSLFSPQRSHPFHLHIQLYNGCVVSSDVELEDMWRIQETEPLEFIINRVLMNESDIEHSCSLPFANRGGLEKWLAALNIDTSEWGVSVGTRSTDDLLEELRSGKAEIYTEEPDKVYRRV